MGCLYNLIRVTIRKLRLESQAQLRHITDESRSQSARKTIYGGVKHSDADTLD
jgi:hypothetical protein